MHHTGRDAGGRPLSLWEMVRVRASWSSAARHILPVALLLVTLTLLTTDLFVSSSVAPPAAPLPLGEGRVRASPAPLLARRVALGALYAAGFLTSYYFVLTVVAHGTVLLWRGRGLRGWLAL